MIGLGLSEIVIIPLTIAWLWAVIDCAIDKKRSGQSKVTWIIALLIFNILAAIAYWIAKIASRRITPSTIG